MDNLPPVQAEGTSQASTAADSRHTVALDTEVRPEAAVASESMAVPQVLVVVLPSARWSRSRDSTDRMELVAAAVAVGMVQEVVAGSPVVRWWARRLSKEAVRTRTPQTSLADPTSQQPSSRRSVGLQAAVVAAVAGCLASSCTRTTTWVAVC